MLRHQPVFVYAKASKFFHWLIAFLVMGMLGLSFFLDDLSASYKPTGYTIHKSIGLVILALMLIRIFWIFYHGRPSLPLHVPRWERIFSRIVQYSFYVLLLIMPLSGWILSTASDHVPQFLGLYPLPFPGIPTNKEWAAFMDNTHKITAWLLVFLLFLHVSGALKHHFWDKDKVLRSMWF